MRGVYFEALKRPRGAPVGNENKTGKAHTYGENQIPKISGIDFDYKPTAEKTAKALGVSHETVKRDARLVRALKVLGLSNADFAAADWMASTMAAHGHKKTANPPSERIDGPLIGAEDTHEDRAENWFA